MEEMADLEPFQSKGCVQTQVHRECVVTYENVRSKKRFETVILDDVKFLIKLLVNKIR